MKRYLLSFLLLFAFVGSEEFMFGQDLPQDAARIYYQMDSVARAKGDSLGRLQALKLCYDEVQKYNWKEAREVLGELTSLKEALVSGSRLDASLARYADHQYVTILHEYKVAEMSRVCAYDDAEGYKAIRDYAASVLRSHPTCLNRSFFEETIERLDRKMLRATFSGNIYPGEEVALELDSRNVSSIEYCLCDGAGAVVESGAVPVGERYSCNVRTVKPLTINAVGVYNLTLVAAGVDTFFVNDIHVSKVAVLARHRAGNVEAWAVDGKSGKPLSSYTAVLSDDGKEYCRKTFSGTSGFAVVGKGRNEAELRVSIPGDSFARAITVGAVPSALESSSESFENCAVFTDRTLYRPGDKVQFKLIAYKTDFSKAAVLSGKSYKVELRQSRKTEVLASCELKTSEFGSASGSFDLSGLKPGRYYIYVGGQSQSFDIAEYVDPKFYVSLEPFAGVYRPGQEVVVSGDLRSYAGYACDGATVRYAVRCYIDGVGTIAEGLCTTNSQGHFVFPFTAFELPKDAVQAFYSIEIQALDPSGESHQASTWLTVGREPAAFELDFGSAAVMCDTVAVVCREDGAACKVALNNLNGELLEGEATWTLRVGGAAEGTVVASGSMELGSSLDLSGFKPGSYTLTFEASVAGCKIVKAVPVVILSTASACSEIGSLDFVFYKVESSRDIAFILGSDSARTVVVEVIAGDKIFYRNLVYLASGSRSFSIPWQKAMSDDVIVNVVGVKNLHQFGAAQSFGRPRPSHTQDLRVEALREGYTAGETVTVSFAGAPSSEILASVYDITADRYHPNYYGVMAYMAPGASQPFIMTSFENRFIRPYYGLGIPMGQTLFMRAESAANKEVVAEDSVAAGSASSSDVEVRSDLSQTLAFEPFIRTNAHGDAEFEFRTGDLLTTFRLLAFSHDKAMNTGSASAEFVVNKPLMVQPQWPLALTAGDKIDFKVKVVSLVDELSDVTVGLEMDGFTFEPYKVALAAGESKTVSFAFQVPSDVTSLAATAYAKSDYYTDAEKQLIKVLPSVQTLTESISFLRGQGSIPDAKEALTLKLGGFNGTFSTVEFSTFGSVIEALAQFSKPSGTENLIDWFTYYYAATLRSQYLASGMLSSGEVREFEAVLRHCQTPSGGFSWYPGLEPSLALTVFILEKGADFHDALLEPYFKRALEYVDRELVSGKYNYICLQALATRLRYGRVDYADKLLDSVDYGKLTILQKASYYEALKALDRSKEAAKVLRSLANYAVKNPRIGYYFPNAVPYFRGMISNELYAHCKLLKIFKDAGNKKLTEGLAQWILLQKRNQSWSDNIATLDAASAVLTSGAKDLVFEAVLYTYTAPASAVRPFSNELSATVTYYRDGKALVPGDVLHLGDEIRAEYKVYSTENRSFVRLRAAHPACMYPVNELSRGFWFYYTTKSAGVTEYYFQTLPEEDTTYSEMFRVQYEGTFSGGITTIESLYAPEYRGNNANTVWNVRN